MGQRVDGAERLRTIRNYPAKTKAQGIQQGGAKSVGLFECHKLPARLGSQIDGIELVRRDALALVEHIGACKRVFFGQFVVRPANEVILIRNL